MPMFVRGAAAIEGGDLAHSGLLEFHSIESKVGIKYFFEISDVCTALEFGIAFANIACRAVWDLHPECSRAKLAPPMKMLARLATAQAAGGGK